MVVSNWGGVVGTGYRAGSLSRTRGVGSSFRRLEGVHKVDDNDDDDDAFERGIIQ